MKGSLGQEVRDRGPRFRGLSVFAFGETLAVRVTCRLTFYEASFGQARGTL